MMSAMSGLGYVPHIVLTNDRVGAQIPSVWPSAHFWGIASTSPPAGGSSAAAAEGAGASALAKAAGEDAPAGSGSLVARFADAPPQAATEQGNPKDRFITSKRSTGGDPK